MHFTSVRDRVPGTPTTSTYKRESAAAAFLGRTLTSNCSLGSKHLYVDARLFIPDLNPQRNDHRGLLIPQIDLHQPDQLYVNRASAHVRERCERDRWEFYFLLFSGRCDLAVGHE